MLRIALTPAPTYTISTRVLPHVGVGRVESLRVNRGGSVVSVVLVVAHLVIRFQTVVSDRPLKNTFETLYSTIFPIYISASRIFTGRTSTNFLRYHRRNMPGQSASFSDRLDAFFFLGIASPIYWLNLWSP